MAREAIIHAVEPFDFHDVRYYAILYAYTNDPDTHHEARLAHDAIYPNPKEGDTVLIEAILNMVTEIKKTDPELIKRILVIDFNLQNHARIRAHGFRVAYGDISNPETLRHHGILGAKIILSTINNTYLRGISNEDLVDEIRHINPDARVIATADNDDAATELLNRGAFRAVSPPAYAAPAYTRALLDALRAGESDVS